MPFAFHKDGFKSKFLIPTHSFNVFLSCLLSLLPPPQTHNEEEEEEEEKISSSYMSFSMSVFWINTTYTVESRRASEFPVELSVLPVHVHCSRVVHFIESYSGLRGRTEMDIDSVGVTGCWVPFLMTPLLFGSSSHGY